MKLDNVRLVGDGTANGTKVLVNEEELRNVQRAYVKGGKLHLDVIVGKQFELEGFEVPSDEHLDIAVKNHT